MVGQNWSIINQCCPTTLTKNHFLPWGRSEEHPSGQAHKQDTHKHRCGEEDSITNVTALDRQVVHGKTNACNQAADLSKSEILHLVRKA